ncbi:MAG: response regulator [Acidiferrobacterales bacterium]|nr:response regulator [Acidiferrobacterales bacterium]
MQNKILLVEDEQVAAEIIHDYLEEANYTVEVLNSGEGVVDRIRGLDVDLLLLDLTLPGVDGTTICMEIRKFSDIPIIMLTARVDESDRLIGYEIGADDYICKPVNPREILARVRVVLKRTQSTTDASETKQLQLSDSGRTASFNGDIANLTSSEFQLLRLLYDNQGKIFSRKEVLAILNENTNNASERSVDANIKKLRKKLAAIYPDGSPIRSVYGSGYKYEV